jgi:hypothetical protein
MSMVTGSSTARPYSPPGSNGGASAGFVPKQSVIPSAAPPSSMVTLSDQARSTIDGAVMAASATSTGNASSVPLSAPVAPPEASGPSTYESMKRGIAAAVGEVEDVAGAGLHAVVNGVETAVSSANSLVRGVLDSPFVIVSKVCDAAGAVIDEL